MAKSLFEDIIDTGKMGAGIGFTSGAINGIVGSAALKRQQNMALIKFLTKEGLLQGGRAAIPGALLGGGLGALLHALKV